jgi:hypothetical protein
MFTAFRQAPEHSRTQLLQGLQTLAGAVLPEIFGGLEIVRSLQPDRLAGAPSKII